LNAHHSSGWFFFTRPLKDIHIKWYFFKFFSSTNVIGGFKAITTSFTIIEFSPTSVKIKRVAEIIWYLHLKGVNAFI
jgi:hypothetical protein